LAVGPFFTSLPQRIYASAKFPAGLDLLLNHRSLFDREEARARLASDGLGKAEIGTVPRLGIIGTRTARFAALNHALGHWAAAHGLSLGNLGGELAHWGRDVVGWGNGHVSSYGTMNRKKRVKKHGHIELSFLWRTPLDATPDAKTRPAW
jgi:hypothetical protein